MLVLHAHIPFVHRTAEGNSLQERWLYEAVLESYLPLLQAFDRLRRDGVPFRAAVSLAPPLLGMLERTDYRQGVLRHADRLLELVAREEERTRGTAFAPVVAMYRQKLLESRAFFAERLRCDLMGGFGVLAATGHLELLTSAATHAFLPLTGSRRVARAQIRLGLAEFERRMGFRPQGFWLPECGYFPGVEDLLSEAGVRYFFAETHAVLHARPRPCDGVHRPVLTPARVAAFGRDPESSRQVWDRYSGYPGDRDYREFYRDVGWDLPLDYVGPYVLDGGVRADTGLKYYRISGEGRHKEPYAPERARAKAAEHARHFVAQRREQVGRLVRQGIEAPVIVAPYDAELFGHWWFEGPHWLEEVFRALARQDDVTAVTPAAYLDRHPADHVCRLPMSSWGAGGYNQVWLSGANDWLYPRLHRAEELMEELAGRFPRARGVVARALGQAARELLLAQSSDWAFMMSMDSAAGYAAGRAVEHLEAFEGLAASLIRGDVDAARLAVWEERDPLFPDLDYRTFAAFGTKGGPSRRRRVLMLTWEFPPFVVGGLGRHVAGLAHGLARLGDRVAVLTASSAGVPTFERFGRLRVWRVGPEPRRDGGFLAWVYRFNEALVSQAAVLLERERFDLIHAHDWMVGPAAACLKQRFGLPVVATIHATEWGRNGGLATDLQRFIHGEEWRLTDEACRVIACSRYMQEEIRRLFLVPRDRLRLIPNGVEAACFALPPLDPGVRNRYADPDERIVLYVGRLVAEKGVQVLLRAVPAVLARQPRTVFLVAGCGEYEGELLALAGQLRLGDRVRFLGHVDEAIKRQLMRWADVVVVPSLYEPFGIVALEAMAAGRPVVVSAAGGLAEIVSDEVSGLTVPPGQASALAAAIARVLGDDALACRLGAGALQAAREGFTWESVADRTRGVYDEALPAPAGASRTAAVRGTEPVGAAYRAQ